MSMRQESVVTRPAPLSDFQCICRHSCTKLYMFFSAKVFILQYFLCNRKIPKNWCEANTVFLGIFLGHKFIFCNSTERPQTVCDRSLVVIKTIYLQQRAIMRNSNFCRSNGNIEMWHFLCYCLHSYLKCTDLLISKPVDTEGVYTQKGC